MSDYVFKGACAWCDPTTPDFDPFDLDDAYQTLCRTHVAEWAGVSVSGLDRLESAERADMVALGILER